MDNRHKERERDGGRERKRKILKKSERDKSERHFLPHAGLGKVPLRLYVLINSTYM